MNQSDDVTNSQSEPAESNPGRARVALRIIDAVLALEALMLVALVIWLVVDLLALQPSSYATALALIVLVAIGAIWLVATAVGSLRRAPWSRPSTIVWQILQISVAVGAFQGFFARPDLGWVLLVPALAVIGLMLWTPVRMVYTPPEYR